MQLKTYQQNTLAALQSFFELSTALGPKQAYEQLTQEPELASRLGPYGGSYTALKALPDLPYVCLRLPTGGGKTILAAHAIDIACQTWMETEFPLILWLVPSNTIRTQTAEALKNTRHPYRQALDKAFGGRVRVFDISDFTQILPHDLKSNLCVVVGTIQTLRVNNTDGRKVYAHHEMLEQHFSQVNPNTAGLGRIEATGGIKFSFANLMHLHRPLMIVDEAHNAVTGLSEDMQARVNPSAIIEFTATPQKKSNTLYSVSALELKQEEMVKLPIVLAEHQIWQDAVTNALITRQQREEEAQHDKDYIRPIVLFQAENKDKEVTVEVLKKQLIETQGIDEREIAVVTGDQRELDGLNLMSADCPVRYIITVQALKEGWDCPFAYVFCSVANVKSATDVEQLLGRVLRMPYAKCRAQDSLNKAYAHVTSKNFSEAALALKDRLVNMGFDEDEALESIEPAQIGIEGSDLWRSRKQQPRLQQSVDVSSEVRTELATVAPNRILVHEDIDGKTKIEFSGVPSAIELDRIFKILPTEQVNSLREEVEQFVSQNMHLSSPAEHGASFVVPAQMAIIQGELELIDPRTYIEFIDLNLSKHPARLEHSEFNLNETADFFEIDLDGQRLVYRQLQDMQQSQLDLIELDNWSHAQLVAWLARHTGDPEISHGDLVGWLSGVVTYLTGPRDLSIAALNRCKFPLMRKLKEKIQSLKQADKEQVYQLALLADDAMPSVSLDQGFRFHANMFAGVRAYNGSYQFAKHFLGPYEVARFDGDETGEEFKCAQALDSLRDVKHWVRNVAKHPDAFFLPLRNGRFYPDFVAELNDGRILVVEYKGAQLATNEDTKAKRAAGHIWAQSSNGTCLFVVVEKTVDGLGMREQLMTVVS